jgi:hypothetical protein
VTTLDPFAHYDGVYVLGALSDDERAEFELHLNTCAACTERVRELAPLPAMLAGQPSSAYLDDIDEPPPSLLPDLLRGVRSQRRKRQLLTGGLAGLAAACLIALVVAVWPSSSPAKSPSAPLPQAMTALRSTPVHVTALITPVKWGTQIKLNCQYDAYAPGIDYQLVVVDKHNAAHQAGSWTLTPGTVSFTGGTSLPRDQISKIEITLADDAPILQLKL